MMKVYVIAMDHEAKHVETGRPIAAGGLFSFSVSNLDELKRWLPKDSHFDAYGSVESHALMIRLGGEYRGDR